MYLRKHHTYTDAQLLNNLCLNHFRSSRNISNIEIQELYNRIIDIYYANTAANIDKYDFKHTLDILERLLSPANHRIVPQFDIQARMLLSQHFNRPLTASWFTYHEESFMHNIYLNAAAEQIYKWAGAQLFSMSLKNTKKFSEFLKRLWQEKICETACQLNIYIPEALLKECILQDKSDSFYIHLQSLITGYKTPENEEEQALLHTMELVGLSNMHPNTHSTLTEIPLHV